MYGQNLFFTLKLYFCLRRLEHSILEILDWFQCFHFCHKILANMAHRFYHLTNYKNQLSFSWFGSIIVSINILYFISKNACNKIKVLNIVYIDIHKAFDSVSHREVWKTLANKDIPSLIYNLFSYYNSYFIWNISSLS